MGRQFERFSQIDDGHHLAAQTGHAENAAIRLRYDGQARHLHDFPNFEDIDAENLGAPEMEQEELHPIRARQPGTLIDFQHK